MRINRWKGGRTSKRKLPVCCGRRLAGENYQCDVVCELSIREASDLLFGGDIFVPDRDDGVDMDRYGSQLIG